jgi:predicted hydrocarbon binding protein
MIPARKYAFSWQWLGDADLGRPNLGGTTRIEVYRLMQYCFRDAIEAELGTDVCDRLTYQAGKLAGGAFYRNMLTAPTSFNDFVAQVQTLLQQLGIGILRVEQADLAAGDMVLTVSEDLDCSGLPDLGDVVCTYDEGFIAGLLESYTGDQFEVKEVDCWCTGDRTCRFTVHRIARDEGAA